MPSKPTQVKYSLGYGYYVFEDGVERGYTVDDTCNDENCNKEIHRGVCFLCYSCLGYFCWDHLFVSEVEYNCFAGSSGELCSRCLREKEKELENEAKSQT